MTIAIDVNFRRLLVDGPPAALDTLAAELACEARDFDADAYGRAMTILEFFWNDHRGRLVARPGMLRRLAGVAAANSWGVDVTDRRRFAPEFEADIDVLAALAVRDAMLARQLARHPDGQVEVSDEADLLDSLLLVCRLFTTLDVLVMVATVRRARKIWYALRKTLQDQVQLAHGRWQKAARVVVCPYCHVTGDVTAWPVVLLPDPPSLASESAFDKVTVAAGRTHYADADGVQTRVYAFPRADWRPGKRAALAVEAVAGANIFSVDRGKRRVTVSLCPTPSVLRTRGLEGLAYKRHAYWGHDARNRLVATVALAIAGRRLTRLWDMGALLDQPETLFEAMPVPLRVVVLVESAEHADVLGRLLPGWGSRDLARPDAGRSAASTIMTVAYMAAHGIEADVVVRADGGGPLGLKGFPRPRRYRDRRPALLLDFDDRFDPRSIEATRRRTARYRECGWALASRRANKGATSFRVTTAKKTEWQPASRTSSPPPEAQSPSPSPPPSPAGTSTPPPDRRRDGPKPWPPAATDAAETTTTPPQRRQQPPRTHHTAPPAQPEDGTAAKTEAKPGTNPVSHRTDVRPHGQTKTSEQLRQKGGSMHV
jgi:hypothetical protein